MQAVLQATVGQPAAFSVQEGVGGVQLVDDDAKRLISIAPNMLSVHVLRPYEGWVRFQPRTASAVAAYKDVVGVETVQRLGLRYVNRIVIPTPAVDLDEYFTCAPRSPEGLPDRMASLLSRVEYVYDDGKKLIVTFATIEATPGTCAFLLDLDGVWEGQGIGVDVVLPILDDLHERIGSAFETLITDKTREVFDASGT